MRAEAKEIKRKTARMVALFNEQKKEMDQKLSESVGAKSDVGQLEAQRIRDKHLIENLRDEIASLKESLQQQQRQQQQARTYEAPPPSFLPAAAPPPPPPPPPAANRPTKSSVVGGSSGGGPTCPKCKRVFAAFDDFYSHEPCPGAAGMLASIQGGVALKKAPAPVAKAPVVEKKPGGQGSFAEVERERTKKTSF